MVKPFVGVPSGDLSGCCGYAPDLDQPGCPAPATVHLRVQDSAWGMVALPTCDAHLGIAESAAMVLGRHPYGPGCSSAAETLFFPTHCEAGS